MCTCCAEFALPSAEDEMVSICGQMQRLPVYTIDIEDTQLALWQLVHKCISAVLRLRRGVGFLSAPARIFSDKCGTRGLSISLLGEPSTSAVPLTKLVLHGNNIAVGFGAAVCMQDILLQNGMSSQGGALWVHQAKLQCTGAGSRIVRHVEVVVEHCILKHQLLS